MDRPGAGVRLSVLAPVLSPQLLPVAASIRMSEGEHQIATLTVLTPLARDRAALEASVPSSLVLPEGTPVAFTWGSSLADMATWYGYVASREVQASAAQHGNTAIPVVPVRYTLTGISMPMQSPRARAYTGVTASAAARRVIADYNLAAYVTPHPRIWPTLAQGTLSDFAWLGRLAELVGYRLVVDTDRISFAPAEIDLTPASVAVPVVNRNIAPGIYDTLITFDPASGQSDPSGAVAATQAAFAVRPSSGTPALAAAIPAIATGTGGVTAPTFTRIATGTAQSYSDAAYNAAAAASASRYWVYAKAKVDGSARLRPGRSVLLAGSGLPTADQGTWRVSTVTHTLELSAIGRTTSSYYAHLELGRDQADGLDVRPPHPPLARASAPVLTGGRWSSPGGSS